MDKKAAGAVRGNGGGGGLVVGGRCSRRVLIAVLAVVALVLFYGWTLRRQRWPSVGGPHHNSFPWQAPESLRKLQSEGDFVVKPEVVHRLIDERPPYVPPERATPYNFTGFNNVTGIQTGAYLVPNFVHFLRFDEEEFDFLDFVVVLSALRRQRPDRLFFHTNVRFKGEFWGKLLLTPGFADVVEIVHVDIPSEIFGQAMDNGYRVWHAGDITRLRILMKYGGIFLDNDSYLVQSLDQFRRFEMTLGWDEGQFLGTQVLVAHPDARFLNEWLESYRGAYDKDKWYYNAGERPTVEVLYKHPEHVHRVKLLFGVHYLIHKVFKAGEVWPEWRDQIAVHLLKRHQDKKFTKDNFQQPPTTLREMIYDVYDPVSDRARLF